MSTSYGETNVLGLQALTSFCFMKGKMHFECNEMARVPLNLSYFFFNLGLNGDSYTHTHIK